MPCRSSSRRHGGSRGGGSGCTSCRPRPRRGGAWASAFSGYSLSASAPLSRPLFGCSSAGGLSAFVGAASAFELNFGLHFGFGHLRRVSRRTGAAVVRLEADRRTDLELDGGEHLLHLAGEVRVFEKLTYLLRHHAK